MTHATFSWRQGAARMATSELPLPGDAHLAFLVLDHSCSWSKFPPGSCEHAVCCLFMTKKWQALHQRWTTQSQRSNVGLHVVVSLQICRICDVSECGAPERALVNCDGYDGTYTPTVVLEFLLEVASVCEIFASSMIAGCLSQTILNKKKTISSKISRNATCTFR